MPTKLETARRAADYARAEEAREEQVGRDLSKKKSAAEAALLAAETETRDAARRKATGETVEVPRHDFTAMKLEVEGITEACATQDSVIAKAQRVVVGAERDVRQALHEGSVALYSEAQDAFQEAVDACVRAAIDAGGAYQAHHTRFPTPGKTTHPFPSLAKAYGPAGEFLDMLRHYQWPFHPYDLRPASCPKNPGQNSGLFPGLGAAVSAYIAEVEA
ncbi:hypothetical protein [Sphingomonas phyllosphaerae]|uniref:hypothetical protein n=1 Tax=Sphingomonas phyllosphaerae TaxID=257003 RepID=UPI0003B73F37|nr:hypothetical protein [Sphingomonas phyllosphaerae]